MTKQKIIYENESGKLKIEVTLPHTRLYLDNQLFGEYNLRGLTKKEKLSLYEKVIESANHLKENNSCLEEVQDSLDYIFNEFNSRHYINFERYLNDYGIKKF